MDIPQENFVIVRPGNSRKWKVFGVLFTIISFGSYFALGIWLFNYFRSTDPIFNASANKTANDSEYGTLETFNLSTTLANQAEMYKNYTLPDSIVYEMSRGQPLGHSICWTSNMHSDQNGFVDQIHLRLFTHWQGNAPLYVFIIQLGDEGFQITRRYATQPKGETTEWQTINIPFGALPIFAYNFLAVGMQDESDTNQIYTVEAIGMTADQINAETIHLSTMEVVNKGFALGYRVAYNAITTTTATASVH